MYYIIYLHICYIRNSYVHFTKMLFDFGTFANHDCSDMLYQNFWYVWIKKFYSFSAHLWIRPFRYIISEFLICLNQKILLIFGTFMNQTVPIYYIRISHMFESKNSTYFRHIYESDRSDILYQNIWYVWIKKFYSCLAHLWIRPFQ